ncbi:TetR family transcriptional regulator [Streptomyces sp. NPDC058657]|uniref:TetR family transcriptional regulator n=1 Tax=unclassified Streptomyces TaxID=2593676 RepID=UPI003657A23D
MQERAARTRQAVLEAAAEEFAERGYQGASLQRMVWRAATSIGALTFHFGTKTALAHEVRTTGRAHLTHCLQDRAPTADPLRELRTLIGRLAHLAREDPFVRAARRLETDRHPSEPPLAQTWLPALRDLLDRAHSTHRLRPGVSREDATTLLTHLAEGAMSAHDTTREDAHHTPHEDAHHTTQDRAHDTGRATPRSPAPAPDTPQDPPPTPAWDSLWDVVLHGLAADRPTEPHQM